MVSMWKSGSRPKSHTHTNTHARTRSLDLNAAGMCMRSNTEPPMHECFSDSRGPRVFLLNWFSSRGFLSSNLGFLSFRRKGCPQARRALEPERCCFFGIFWVENRGLAGKGNCGQKTTPRAKYAIFAFGAIDVKFWIWKQSSASTPYVGDQTLFKHIHGALIKEIQVSDVSAVGGERSKRR